MNFYVYLHRRKTDGKVFYVGKGKDKRAWSSSGRNTLWERTANKYGWTVEIVEKDLQDWYAFELERELIAYYGRRDLGDGYLTNLSDGGDGPSNMNEDARKRISEANSGLNCYKADQKVYKFYNHQTKEVYEGKRVDFENTYGTKIGRLFTSKVDEYCSHFGWFVLDKFPKGFNPATLQIRRVDGDDNPNSDEVIYTFFNIYTLEKFTGTRFQLKSVKNVNTNVLFFTGTSYKGWAVFNNQSEEELDKLRNPTKYLGITKRDSRFLNLIHVSGDTFQGTRQEFKEKYRYDLNHLLSKKPSKQQKGWSLAPHN